MKNSRKLSFFLMWAVSISVRAEVVTDGTLGSVQNLSDQMIIPQTLGKTVGNNLFHSFQTFNINTGESATFTGSDTLHNVISRVTGEQVSNIDGLLKSEIPNANFYFINPAGVTFGANAQVDVPGAFHVSTADHLTFADGAQFSASNLNASTLSIAEPQSFGFLNNSPANIGNITLKGAQLFTLTNNTVDFVADNIFIHNATLFPPAGEIRLVALGNHQAEVGTQQDTAGKLPLPEMLPSQSNGGTLLMDNSVLATVGYGGGRTAFWAGNIELNHSVVDISNKSTLDATAAKGVDIRAHSLSLANNSIIYSVAINDGNSAAINLHTDLLEIFADSGIISDTYASGHAGNIDIVTESFFINGHNAGIFANTISSGNAANINLTTGSLNIAEGTIASYAYSFGKAGNISITAKNIFLAANAAITSNTYGTGNAGDIDIDVGTLNITDGKISSDAFLSGKAGNVSITAKNIFLAAKEKGIATITSSTFETGNAGSVTVNTDFLTISDGLSYLASSTYGAGNAGSVTVNADQIKIIGHGNYEVNSAPGIYSIANPAYRHQGIPQSTGNAGAININSGLLEVKGGGIITSDTEGLGNAGNINIITEHLLIDGQSPAGDSLTKISSDAFGQSQGNPGSVKVHSKTVEIRNQGQISSYTYSPAQTEPGKVGDIFISASEKITLLNHGVINSSTYNKGNAGHVSVTAPIILIDNATISAAAEKDSSGKTGDVHVNASKTLQLTNNAKITIQNDANVDNPAEINAGLISVSAPHLLLKDSAITGQSSGNLNAGHVNVAFSEQLSLDSSFITTSANSGHGGSITISSDYGAIKLQNSGFLTSVAQAIGNGGDINVTANALIMNTGVIQANAVGGKGGDIYLRLNNLIPSENQLIKGGARLVWQPFISGFNIIQAASANNINGAVNISSPQFNISGSISGLDSSKLVLPIIDHALCQDSTIPASSLVKTGKGGIPDDGLKFSFVPAMQMQNVLQQAQDILTTYGINEKQKSQPCRAL